MKKTIFTSGHNATYRFKAHGCPDWFVVEAGSFAEAAKLAYDYIRQTLDDKCELQKLELMRLHYVVKAEEIEVNKS